MEQFYAILYNIFVVESTAFVIILAYSIRSVGNDFDLYTWVMTNRNRFISGSLLGALVSVLIVISSDAEALLTLIGFNASRTPVAIGMALGAFLITAVSGTKPKTVTPEGQ